MPKNLMVCCDGTANAFARDHTNVLGLFSVPVQDPPRQLACYHPGLGTMEAVDVLTSTSHEVTKLLGKAIGYGLECVAPSRCGGAPRRSDRKSCGRIDDRVVVAFDASVATPAMGARPGVRPVRVLLRRLRDREGEAA